LNRHYGNQYGFPQKPKNIPPYDSVIPLLVIYPKEYKSAYNRDTCISMFIATLLTRTSLSNQPKCPSSNGWKKKVWYKYINRNKDKATSSYQ
jgi:hypothetical protein